MSPTAWDRPLILWSAAASMLVVLLIGLFCARRTKTARDFFIAGQGIGLTVTGLTTMSAAFSGFVFLGGPGLTYQLGIGSLWIILPLGFTGGLLCRVVGRPLRLLAEVRPIYTVAEAIEARFGRRVAALGAVAVLSGTIAYLGLQLQAMGVLFQVLFGADGAGWGMAVGLAVLLLYSVAGGMIAGVYTDLFQGVLMLLAAVGVFTQALRVTGGWTVLTDSIADAGSFGASFLEPLGRVPALTAFGFFFVFGVGVLGQPHILHKFFMLDDPRKLRWLPLVLGSSQSLCVLLWLGVGLAVPALVAQGRLEPLAQPDQAAALFLLEFTPELLSGIAFAGILAAIMSTADSFINIGSAALVRDLPRALGLRVTNELRWGRVAVLLVAATAAVVAYLYGDLIALLGTFAFGTFAAAIAPCVAVGFNWAGVTRRAAGASIVVGLLANIGLEFLARRSPAPAALPAAVALAASFAVLLGVSWLDRGADPPIAADVRAVMGSP